MPLNAPPHDRWAGWRRLTALAGGVLLGVLPSVARGQEAALQSVAPGGVLQAVAGYKDAVVLVDFWATWCASCREELPHLVRLERELHDQGLRLVIVSMDEPQQAKAAVQFLTSIGAQLPQYIRAPHTTDSAWVATMDPTWDGALPGLFLYGRSGDRLMRFRGERTTMDQIRNVILQVLKLPRTPVSPRDSAHTHDSR